MAKHPAWYTRYDYQTEPHLIQGVILPNFNYLNPHKIKSFLNSEESDTRFPLAKNKDVIILTQSCELLKDTLKHVHLAPVLTLTEVLQRHDSQFNEKFTKDDFFHQLKSNQRHSKFLLNKCPMKSFKTFYDEFLVVYLDLAFVVSPEYIHSYISDAKQRYFLAVNPPYREALAQSYGRYFMRVGNPIDYDKLET